MNSWEDKKFVERVKQIGRKKLVIAALWTEVCLTFPLLEALKDGYEVYFVVDACGGTSAEAHRWAMERCLQAGGTPVTWQQVLLEFQRDWSRKEHYTEVMNLVKEHSGAYGMGVRFMFSL